MFDSNRRAAVCWVLLASFPLSYCPGTSEYAQLQGLTLVYLNMGALTITSTSISQAQATVLIGCLDNTGQTFANVSVRVVAAATSLSSTGAAFNVDQQVGYLQSGRSIACSVSLAYSGSEGANVTVVPLLVASNASCWFSYSLFVASGSSAVATSWTCSTSGVSYTLVCQGCPETASTPASTSSGLSKGQIKTICIVIGCSLVSALAVIYVCSRVTRWHKTDVRDTRHMPEDAAKDVNLKPPGFFVATTASQRQSEGPKRPTASVQSTGTPPVVIVSYGSSSTPTGTNFHHGHYALAQPEAAAHLQQARPAAQSEQSSIAEAKGSGQPSGRPLQPLPEERPIESSTCDQSSEAPNRVNTQ